MRTMKVAVWWWRFPAESCFWLNNWGEEEIWFADVTGGRKRRKAVGVFWMWNPWFWVVIVRCTTRWRCFQLFVQRRRWFFLESFPFCFCKQSHPRNHVFFLFLFSFSFLLVTVGRERDSLEPPHPFSCGPFFISLPMGHVARCGRRKEILSIWANCPLREKGNIPIVMGRAWISVN